MSENKDKNGFEPCGATIGKIHCITVAGQVEGHIRLPQDTKATKYEKLLPSLVWAEENPDIEGVLILLNTVGGDVEAGLAIAELISGMKKPTVSLVLGGGHSIGVPLAVSADVSFIVPSATMTIHPVRTSGTVIGVAQAFDYIKEIQHRINDFIVRHSNIERDKLEKYLFSTEVLANDVGTVVDGKQAVDDGLIDRLGSLSEAIDALKQLCEKK